MKETPLYPNLQHAIRSIVGMSQRKFARENGIDESLLSNVICGHYNISQEIKEKWAVALGKPVEELFKPSEEK
jgi:transcriptional regulator with XRE-family HTH domain